MNLVETRLGRRALFAGLYFVEGAPVGFLWWALPSLMTARGVGPERVGSLLGWLVLPWALKWIWSPWIDRDTRFGLRGWIVAAQVGMALSLVPLLFGTLGRFEWLVPLLLAHAVCASTQDAAIDALMIRVTPIEERGRLTGWMQAGMLAGRSLLGGGALLVHGRLGDRGLVVTLIAVVAAGLVLNTTYRTPLRRGGEPRVSWRAVAAALFGRRAGWIGLAFAATAGAGFEALGGFAGPILTEASGGTDMAGRFFLIHAVVATAIGGLVGGAVADRLGAVRATALLGLLLGVAVLATAARSTASPGELQAWLDAVYLGIGGFTAASYALFIALTEPRLAATSFSAYMGATNLCESWSVSAAGRMIPVLGYGTSIALLQGLAFAALGALALLGRRTARDPFPSPDRSIP